MSDKLLTPVHIPKRTTVAQFLRARINAYLTSSIGDKKESLMSLRVTEWSPLFEKLMRNRLLMGRFRYGKMGDPEKGDYDNMQSAMARIRAYQRDGNLEHLVDVANLMVVEFVHGKHPNRHFSAGDDGEHVERKG